MAKQFTWGEAVDYTLRTRDAWRNGNSRKTNMINAGHFTESHGRSFPTSKITSALVNQYAVDLEETGMSNATINRCISAICTVLNHCAADDLCVPPPKFRRRRESEGRILFFTKDEINQMSHASIDVFDRADLAEIIQVAAFTGMRQGELLKLKARDVDLSLNTIHVGGCPDVETKGRNYRSIPIHERIARPLYERLEATAPNIRVFDDWTTKDQLLRAFNKVRRYVGLPEGYCFHSIRHSFATWHAEAGTPMRTLMGLMGHKRIETTLRYAKVTNKASIEAMSAI
jgi:integrase